MKDFDLKSAKNTVPLDRVGDPEDVAEAAFFLASVGASYITGQTLFVDGGRLVRSGAADYEERKA
jgi:NAD(P)-dependent dehydrogenase (short-subunit alcohol dehydrogenase family)